MSFNFKKSEGLQPRKNIGQQTDKAPIAQGVTMNNKAFKFKGSSTDNVKK